MTACIVFQLTHICKIIANPGDESLQRSQLKPRSGLSIATGLVQLITADTPWNDRGKLSSSFRDPNQI